MKKYLLLLSLVLCITGLAQPTIVSFSPASGAVGSNVIITGTNFSTTPTDNIVFFGAQKATVVAGTSTALSVTVPKGASYLPISVTTNKLTAYSVSPFIVTFSGSEPTFPNTSFPQKTSYPLGGWTDGVAIGDLDGDGKTDIVVTNYDSNMVYIFRNITDSNFALTGKITYATGSKPSGIAIGDLDGDGQPEIIVANWETGNNGEGSVSVYRNTTLGGALSFASKIDFITDMGAQGAAVQDMDGDGKPDIVVFTNSGIINVLRNTTINNTISFAVKTQHNQTASNGSGFCVGDIDGDGKPDVAVSLLDSTHGTKGEIVILRNTSIAGTISFAAKITLTTNQLPGGIAMGDVTADNKPELAVCNYEAQTLSVFRNTGSSGNISFANSVEYPTGIRPFAVKITDLDGDGSPDIAVGQLVAGSIAIFKNTSATSNVVSFTGKVEFVTGLARALAIGDLDRDGKPDFAISTFTDKSLVVLRSKNEIITTAPKITSITPPAGTTGDIINIGGLRFTGATAVSFGGVPAAAFTVVSDSLIKATVGTGGSGAVRVTTPAATDSLAAFVFLAPSAPPKITSISPTSGVIGSTVTVTGTNFNNAAVANTVYFGGVKATIKTASATTLTVTVPAGAGYKPVSVTTGGLTGYSQKPFVVIFPSADTVSAATFGSKLTYTTGAGAFNTCAGDLDGDGKVDYVVANYSDKTISIALNTSTKGKISFGTKIDSATTDKPAGMCLADIDGDGKLDIVVSNETAKTVSVFRNTSSGTGVISFAAKIDFTAGTYPGSVTVADLNSDGRPDIIVTNNQDGTVSILKNTTTGSSINFAARANLVTGSSPFGVVVTDVNGDGLPDICVANQGSNSLWVFRNTSIGNAIQFDPNTSNYPTGTQPYNLVVADFDGDGMPDMITANLGSNNISVFRNTSGTSGVVSFAAKTDIPIGVSPNNISAADITGDGKADIAISGSDQSVFVLTNKSTQGNIAFSGKTGFSVQASSSCTLLNDFDNDGRPDLAVGYFSNIAFFRNQIPDAIVLSGFTPAAGAPGTTVTITGRNLTSLTTVSFGGTEAATFTGSTDTTATAVVGFGSSGKVVIKNLISSDSLTGFTFIPVVKINSFSPQSGKIGSQVTISGKNFSSTPANNIVNFGYARATVTAASDTSLTVIVPVGALYKPITVTTSGRTAYSSGFFTVLFDGTPLTSNSFVKQKNDSTATILASNLYSADLDGDGKPDLIKTDGSDSVMTIFMNASAGKKSVSFTNKKTFATGLNPYMVAIGDLDGDGKPDLAVANQGNNTVSVFRNTSTVGNISFATRKDYTIGSDNQAYPNVGYPNVIAIADINNDGKPDIISAAGNSSVFSVLINRSTGTELLFPERKDIGTPGGANRISGARDIAVADMDKDGNADIVFADAIDDAIILFRNTSANGNVSFATSQHYAGGGPASTRLSIADLDGNGTPDIFFTDITGKQFSALRNTSTADSISFANRINFGTANSFGIAVGNFDGDGKPDIISPDLDQSNLHFFRNTSVPGTLSFTPLTDIAVENRAAAITSADFDSDGTPDICLGTGLIVYLNSTATTPIVKSFLPTSAGPGITVTIKGENFTNTSSVSFGGVAASSFTVVSDTLITAIVGSGASGYVNVKTNLGADSLNGFTFALPEISLPDSTKSSLAFNTIKGNYSAVQYFPLAGKRLQSNITITAPASFQVSRSADSGFVSTLSITPLNGAVDSARIYVRFKLDSVGTVNESISITSANAVTKGVTVTGNACDSVVLQTPSINSITKDSTVICIKDSISLSTSGTYNLYKWSTGDTSRNLVVKNSVDLSLRVGSKAGCLSNPSPVLKIIKNTNPVPNLALISDTILLSSSAPNYRWYFNNNIITGNTSSNLVVKKIGFYSVETSNDKICWDHSNDFPIVTLPLPLVNDTATVKAYPNPATGGTFNVVVTLQRATNVTTRVTVTDVGGVVLLQTNKFIFFGKEIKIPITLSVKGTVFVKVDINGDIKTQTVILQ